MIKPSSTQVCNTHACVETKCKAPAGVDYTYQHEAYWVEFSIVGCYYGEYPCYFYDPEDDGYKRTLCKDVLTTKNHNGYLVYSFWIYCPCNTEATYYCCLNLTFSGTYASKFTHKVSKDIDFCKDKIPIYRIHNGYRYSPGLTHCSDYYQTQCNKDGKYLDSSTEFYYTSSYIGRSIERVPI